MNKKLEDFFNMAPAADSEIVESEQEEVNTEIVVPDIDEKSEEVDKVDEALPQVTGLDDDAQMNELIKLAIESHKNLSELGMQVEAAFAGKIFSAASDVLKHAMDAQQYKIDKKLRTVDLQIKKQRLDLQQSVVSGKTNPIQATATAIDRNELMKQLKDNSKNTPDSNK